MDKMSNRREIWVDIVKGFAIIAVVLGHIDYDYPKLRLLPLADILAEFWHVPVFFIVGGFFLTEQRLIQPISFIKNKLRSLYLLILYIYFPILLLHNFFIKIGFYSVLYNYSGKYVTLWTWADFLKNGAYAILGAGREPILGAMWFVYVLFFALCILSVISWALNKLVKNISRVEQVRCLSLMVLAMLFSVLTQIYEITIPRFSNVFTAMWLIYLGMLIKQKFGIQFNKGILLLISILISYYLMVIYSGRVSLNTNKFADLVTLTVSSITCLYTIAFISKKIQEKYLGRLLCLIGKNSFYIMGLQFIGFKICTLLVNYVVGGTIDLAPLKAPAGNNLTLFFLYLVFGVSVPIIIVTFVREAKSLLTKLVK